MPNISQIQVGTTTYDLIDNSLSTALNNKQDKLTFDITPTLGSLNPVQSNGIATSFNSVTTAMSLKAPINSPTFTGTPQAPTATFIENSDQIATTKFVQNLFSTIDGSNLDISVSTETLYIKF